MMQKLTRVFLTVAVLFGVAAVCTFFRAETLQTSAVTSDSVTLPILMYHQISEKPGRLGTYVISPEEFEHDCKLISEMGFETVTVNDLIAYTQGKGTLPQKPIMLTFDDGYESDYVYAFPVLKRYGMRAVSSTVGSYTELYSGDVIKHIDYSHLNWDQMREMQGSGVFEFQNHSYDLHRYSDERKGCRKSASETVWQYDKLIREDIRHAQELFLKNLGSKATCFTYPFGSVDERLRKYIIDCGFSASLGVYEHLNFLTGDPSELYELNRFNRTHDYDIKPILEKAKAPTK